MLFGSLRLAVVTRLRILFHVRNCQHVNHALRVLNLVKIYLLSDLMLYVGPWSEWVVSELRQEAAYAIGHAAATWVNICMRLVGPGVCVLPS